MLDRISPNDQKGVLRVLILEDFPPDAELMVHEMRRSEIDCVYKRVESWKAFLHELKTFSPDVILSDYTLPQFSGMDALRLTLEIAPGTPFIIVTGTLSEETAVECMKAGASDYIIKEHPVRLGEAIKSALKKKQADEKRAAAEEALRQSEQRYRAVTEAATDAIIAVTPEGIIQFANKAVENIFGHPPGSLPGRNIESLMPEYLQSVPTSPSTETGWPASNGGHDVVELRGIHRTGEDIAVEASFAEVADNDKRMVIGIVRDITDRKNALEALQRSESNYRRLVEKARDVIYSLSSEGTIVSLNPAFEAITGWKAKDWIGKSFVPLLHPADVDKALITYQSVLKGETPEPYELRILTRGGDYLVGEFTPAPLSTDGRVTGVLGIARNVTERKRADEQQRRLFEITRAIQSTLTVTDVLTRVVEEVKEVVHYDLCSLFWLDKNNATLHPYITVGTDRLSTKFETWSLNVGEGIAGQVITTGESELVNDAHLDPRSRYPRGATLESEHLMSIPLRSKSSIFGVVNIGRCEGERFSQQEFELAQIFVSHASFAIENARLFEETRASEERYRRFFEEDLAGYFASSMDGRILDCNPAFARMFGFESVSFVRSHNISTFFPSPEQYRDLMTLLQTRHRLEDYSIEFIQRDGKPLFAVANVIGEFSDDGELVGIKGHVSDDTKRKVLEQQLIQSQRMESLGTLAGGIAHDFNNILGIIVGNISLIEEMTEVGQKTRERANVVVQACERGAGLVRQLLTFARKTDVYLEVVQINDTMNEIDRLVRETFPRTVTLKANLDVNLPRILADPNQIHQVALNMVVNARDAMPMGGEIAISTCLVEGRVLRAKFPDATQDSYVCMDVADSGTGMDEPTRARIFEPFFSTKERGRGTGLGLSVVFGIVNNHHGFIDVESEKGKGTNFLIYFPVQSIEVEPAVLLQDRLSEIHGGTETILIVEDEENIMNPLQRILEAKGYTILTAADGLEGIRIYLEHYEEIDVVLMDVGLPKVSGYDAFFQMKAINPNVVAILASGYFEPTRRSAMSAAGVRGFVQKPFKGVEVLNAIHKVLLEDHAT